MGLSATMAVLFRLPSPARDPLLVAARLARRRCRERDHPAVRT